MTSPVVSTETCQDDGRVDGLDYVNEAAVEAVLKGDDYINQAVVDMVLNDDRAQEGQGKLYITGSLIIIMRPLLLSSFSLLSPLRPLLSSFPPSPPLSLPPSSLPSPPSPFSPSLPFPSTSPLALSHTASAANLKVPVDDNLQRVSSSNGYNSQGNPSLKLVPTTCPFHLTVP